MVGLAEYATAHALDEEDTEGEELDSEEERSEDEGEDDGSDFVVLNKREEDSDEEYRTADGESESEDTEEFDGSEKEEKTYKRHFPTTLFYETGEVEHRCFFCTKEFLCDENTLETERRKSCRCDTVHREYRDGKKAVVFVCKTCVLK